MIILALILLTIACLVTALVIFLTTSAIVFSRVAFALLAALLASQGNLVLVPGGGFLNYVAWAALFFGLVYLLSMLPRVDKALKFFCTILMSSLIIEITVMLLGGIIVAIQGEEFEMTVFFQILIKVVCTVFAAIALIAQTKKAPYDYPTKAFTNLMDRTLASLMYGVSAAFLSISLHNSWPLPGVVAVIILLGVAAAAYVADIYLAGKNLFGSEEPKEVVMPK